MITTTIQPEQFLQTDYISRRKLIFRMEDNISLVLVGCGGTGSWLAPSVARIARLLIEKFQSKVHVHFVDPDRVEEKNCYRQNFCHAEIGRYKADALAQRYGLAWGLNIAAHIATLENAQASIANRSTHPYILIGCVDNGSARAQLHRMARNADALWLDCGNFKDAGQVLVGTGQRLASVKMDPFKLPGFCTWLPLPDEQHPELTAETPADGEAGPQLANLSCADLALLDSQGMAINQRLAAEATDYLVRMLLTKDLTKYATYINLASGSSRSKYITIDNIREYIKK